MQTRRGTLGRLASLVIAGALTIAVPATAQQHEHAHEDMAMPSSGMHAALLADLEVLEQKYTGLAEAMVEHFAWRPAEGVRSVSEVFMHIAGANHYVPTLVGVAPPEGMEVASLEEAFGRMGEMEGITDPAEVMEGMSAGFAHARHAIKSVPEEALDDPIDMFGQQATKRAGLILLMTHMHEHLGQMVAYARMNGVTPPWSAGG
jgi:uncharacterized damage-inducible protein DinB